MTSLDPSSLSLSISTSHAAGKSNGTAGSASQKASKITQSIPRIDLEPLYSSLKAVIGHHWPDYKEAISLFLLGRLNQQELALRTNHFLSSNPHTSQLHNQLIVGIVSNSCRDPPEPGVAPWVAANDKPLALGAKASAGDAADLRLKAEVMQLSARDRRRIKDIPEPDSRDPIPSQTTSYQLARQVQSFELPSANLGRNLKTNWDLEIRKRYSTTLACETGEFPDTDSIQNRMTPICYEESLPNGAATGCAGFLSVATEHFIKEILSSLYSATRVNMPGGSISSVKTHKFQRQQRHEQRAVDGGQLALVPNTGMLPIEAKIANAFLPLTLSDIRQTISNGVSELGQFPGVQTRVFHGYEDGEYEEYTTLRELWFLPSEDMDQDDRPTLTIEPRIKSEDLVGQNGVNGSTKNYSVIEVKESQTVDVNMSDDEDWGWEGANTSSRLHLGNLLKDCLNGAPAATA